MFKVKNYMDKLIDLLRSKFGSRLLYVGLQGSYMREEATESSDIDIMLVIDGLSSADLKDYRDIIFSLENPEKSCGFICGKSDLSNWNPLEICHLLNCTKDCYGSLNELVPEYTRGDIRNYIKISVNNLYHEICHRYIHSDKNKNIAKLPASYKSVFFILQNLHYLQTGEFIRTKSELLPLLSDNNRTVLERAAQLGEGNGYDFDESFKLLFNWCQLTMKSV